MSQKSDFGSEDSPHFQLPQQDEEVGAWQEVE